MTSWLSRQEYAQRYGPTAGDRIRLGDTDLWIRIERDDVAYGDELLFGWGRTVRAGLAAGHHYRDSDLDAVVVGAIAVDPRLGVVKTDIGIKEGRIAGIGRAGNPATMDGVEMRIGPHTQVISANGLIATAGGIDSHIHLIQPRLVPAALAGGITTLITAGWEEPLWWWERELMAFETLPVNVGFQASARSEDAGATERLIVEMGCPGLKIHEDQGGYPEIIDATLGLCEAYDVQLCLHTDGLHEVAELEDTVAAVAGRTMHAYHVEGAGGGHMPDLIKLVREPNIVCSSTNPAVPWGPSSAEEHFLMTAIVHGLDLDLAEEAALVRERLHPKTMAAEGPLHELGGIAILSSDSQGMGRIGETVRKAWQLADVMKRWRREALPQFPPGTAARVEAPPQSPPGTAGKEGDDDNERVLRYLSKYTIEPAIAHGIAQHVGTLAPGRLADIVLWAPASFGVRPAAVLKGGVVAWGPLGEGNATVRLAEPVRYGADWGALGRAAAAGSALFVSQAGLEAGIAARTGTGRLVLAVRGCRGLTRADLWANRAAPPVEVDPHDGTVYLDGRVLAAEPVERVPLSRRYLLG